MSATRFLNGFYEIKQWLDEQMLTEHVKSWSIEMKGRNLSYMASDDLQRGLDSDFTKDGIMPHRMGGHRMNEFTILGIPFKFTGEVGGGVYTRMPLDAPVYVVIEESELNILRKAAGLPPLA